MKVYKNMQKYYYEFRTNLFNFNGTTSRPGFWWPTIANLMLYFIAVFLSSLFFKVPVSELITIDVKSTGLYIFMSLISISLIIVTLALLCRRLHDTNHSGWLIIGSGLPFYIGYLIGAYVFILTLLPSKNN